MQPLQPFTESWRVARLEPPDQPVRLVLDTDTFNEIDDQFALAYALASPAQMKLEAVYAAPFHNRNSRSPGDGMELSLAEIHRLLARAGRAVGDFVRPGSNRFMESPDRPVESLAAADLIERAMGSTEEDPLYVVAIGAPTNVASALRLEPAIAARIVILWLGGHAPHWPDAREFNCFQDPAASRTLLDGPAPLVLFPCLGVASHLLVSLAEMETQVAGKNALGDYLTQILREHHDDHFGYAKELWDLAPLAWLVNPVWAPSELIHSPILTEGLTWSTDRRRPLIRCASWIHRNAVMRDLFCKLTTFNSPPASPP